MIFASPLNERRCLNFGVCNRTKGFDKSKIKNAVRADKTAACLFQRGAFHRRTAFFPAPGPRPHQRGGAPYGVRHAAGAASRPV